MYKIIRTWSYLYGFGAWLFLIYILLRQETSIVICDFVIIPLAGYVFVKWHYEVTFKGIAKSIEEALITLGWSWSIGFFGYLFLVGNIPLSLDDILLSLAIGFGPASTLRVIIITVVEFQMHRRSRRKLVRRPPR